MKKLLILLFMVSCSYDSEIRSQSVTIIANVDSVFAVLDSLDGVRKALPDPTTNFAKRIYSEEIFKYRMIDTLSLKFPVLFNKPASVISARIDSMILRHGKPDSTDDRGRRIGRRIDAFLALSLAERKSRIKSQNFLALILYASRNQLIAVIEQFEYQINLVTKKQAIKKLVIGSFYAVERTSLKAFSFSNVTSFDNKLKELRNQYWESKIK